MATGNPTFTGLSISTREAIIRETIKGELENNILTAYLMKAGKTASYSGEFITVPYTYGENDTIAWQTDPSIPVTMAQQAPDMRPQWDFKYLSVGFALNKTDLKKNSGENQVIDLYKREVEKMQLSFRRTLETGLQSDGTLGQIDGLQKVIGTSNSYGNIDRSDATNATWATKSETPGGTLADKGITSWYKLFNACSGTMSADPINLILVPENFWIWLAENKVFDKYQVTGGFPGEPELSVESLRFRRARVVPVDSGEFEKGSANNAYRQTAIFLNTKYWEIATLAGMPDGLELEHFDQVPGNYIQGTQGFWVGNIICKNPNRQGSLAYTGLVTADDQNS